MWGACGWGSRAVIATGCWPPPSRPFSEGRVTWSSWSPGPGGRGRRGRGRAAPQPLRAGRPGGGPRAPLRRGGRAPARPGARAPRRRAVHNSVPPPRTSATRGVSAKAGRSRVDQAAAVIILQSALDAERASGRAPGSGSVRRPRPRPRRNRGADEPARSRHERPRSRRSSLARPSWGGRGARRPAGRGRSPRGSRPPGRPPARGHAGRLPGAGDGRGHGRDRAGSDAHRDGRRPGGRGCRDDGRCVRRRGQGQSRRRPDPAGHVRPSTADVGIPSGPGAARPGIARDRTRHRARGAARVQDRRAPGEEDASDRKGAEVRPGRPRDPRAPGLRGRQPGGLLVPGDVHARAGDDC